MTSVRFQKCFPGIKSARMQVKVFACNQSVSWCDKCQVSKVFSRYQKCFPGIKSVFQVSKVPGCETGLWEGPGSTKLQKLDRWASDFYLLSNHGWTLKIRPNCPNMETKGFSVAGATIKNMFGAFNKKSRSPEVSSRLPANDRSQTFWQFDNLSWCLPTKKDLRQFDNLTIWRELEIRLENLGGQLLTRGRSLSNQWVSGNSDSD